MEETEKAAPKAKKRSSRWPARILWTLVVLGVIAGAAVAAMPKPVHVETAEAKKDALIVTVDEDGTTRVTDRYVISAPLSGNVARISLHPGDEVKQGDVVARILPAKAPLLDTRARGEAEARVAGALAGLRQAEAQIERARAARDFSEADAKSTENLAARGTISQQELERAQLERRSREAELASSEFAAKVARYELAMAQATLGRLVGKGGEGDQFEVTSPVSGRVLKVIQESEGVVQAGTRLLEVGDPGALEIAVDVLTSDAVHIKSGAAVSVVEWGGAPLAGVVRMIEPSAFTRVSALGVEEQRVNAVVDLKAPYEMWRELGDGYRVEARIEVYKNAQAVVVPWSCLFRKDGLWSVFVVSAGHARLRVVKVGRRNDVLAEIVEGVSPGEAVVVHPSDKVQDGVEVALGPAR